MTRHRGRPVDEEIQQAVEAAILHLKLANVSLVRTEVERLLKRTVGWDVIHRNLEKLRDQNKIHKQIMADLGRRKAYVYLAD